VGHAAALFARSGGGCAAHRNGGTQGAGTGISHGRHRRSGQAHGGHEGDGRRGARSALNPRTRTRRPGGAAKEKQMLKVGMVGWRGMVGSVLMQRMREENDFAQIEPVFFSTSNAGGDAPEVPNAA